MYAYLVNLKNDMSFWVAFVISLCINRYFQYEA